MTAIFVVTLVRAAAALAGDANTSRLPKLAVRLLIEVDDGPTMLVLHLTNLDAEPIDRYPPNLGSSKLVMLRPDGRVIDRHAEIDLVGGGKLRQVEPGQSQFWRIPLPDLFKEYSPEGREGTYRLYWSYSGVKSQEVHLVRRPGGPIAKPEQRNLTGEHFTTPQGTVWAFLAGLDGAERGFDSVAWNAANRPELEFVSSIGALMNTNNSLRSRLIKDFGGGAAEAWAYEATPDRLRAIQEAFVTYSEHFEDAVVRTNEAAIRVVRKDTHWFVHPASFGPDYRLAEARLAKRRDAILETGREYREGRYEGLPQIVEGLRMGRDAAGGSVLRLTTRSSDGPGA